MPVLPLPAPVKLAIFDVMMATLDPGCRESRSACTTRSGPSAFTSYCKPSAGSWVSGSEALERP